jgi:hypothetical protein
LDIFGRRTTKTENGSDYQSCKLRLAARSERQPIEKAQKVDFVPLYRVDGYGAKKAAGSVFGSAAFKTESRRGELCPITGRTQLGMKQQAAQTVIVCQDKRWRSLQLSV